MTVVAAVGTEQRVNPVVRTGHRLATALEEELCVLHVVPDEEFEQHREAIQSLPEFGDYSVTQEKTDAAGFARRIARQSLDVETLPDGVSVMGRVGPRVREIIDATEELDASHLVIGRRRRSPVGKAILGNTTQSVLLNSELPITTVFIESEN